MSDKRTAIPSPKCGEQKADFRGKVGVTKPKSTDQRKPDDRDYTLSLLPYAPIDNDDIAPTTTCGFCTAVYPQSGDHARTFALDGRWW